jgi:hypothetical protein
VCVCVCVRSRLVVLLVCVLDDPWTCVQDCRQIFNNARRYNASVDHEVHAAANELQTGFELRLSRFVGARKTDVVKVSRRKRKQKADDSDMGQTNGERDEDGRRSTRFRGRKRKSYVYDELDELLEDSDSDEDSAGRVAPLKEKYSGTWLENCAGLSMGVCRHVRVSLCMCVSSCVVV